MKNFLVLALMAMLAGCGPAPDAEGDLAPMQDELVELQDLSGDWVIASSVGGRIPITVYCSMEQLGSVLSGTCTPEMENPEASAISGTVGPMSAVWGYDVVFNDNPGRIDFTATTLSNEMLEGSLSLSGTVAPFTATRGIRP